MFCHLAPVKTLVILILCFLSFRAFLLKVLVGLFELPEDASTYQDDHFIEVDETPGYEVAYSQLVFASKSEYDPLQGNAY